MDGVEVFDAVFTWGEVYTNEFWGDGYELGIIIVLLNRLPEISGT